ncbi:reprolysin-like metallopeptidase [Polaribacter sp. KT 15]|uniref:reprolysin-like metallopeptidase n=1 Tax=Polaribacter sp. KT 15 TaxID=1896175 RepID=UPI00090A1AB4|nr:zinc-dependent metalloprotease family protein [Polaribacter sp. KT 15]SHM97587.1 Por secretion system C-terminal sorting domain-containing protein [Polaribacter sp. KT 15]
MVIKLNKFFISALFICFSLTVQGQEIWQKIDQKNSALQKKELRSFKNFPDKFSLYNLDVNQVKTNLNSKAKTAFTTIKLPNSEGDLELFKLKESSNFEKGLAEKFPSIKSYTAIGITNPTSFAKVSVGLDGFHAVIFSTNGKTVYVDPYSKDNKEYIVYKTSDLKEEDHHFKCDVEEVASKQIAPEIAAKSLNDGNLRTFRLALVCSGEYAQFHLNNQGISAAASDSEKKAAVLSAMNTSMTRVNGLFEKDLAVKMVIVANNDEVIFLDADTDNITDGDPDEMIDEVQTIADARIGTANYDIGHIFSIGGDGLAGLGVVCVTGQKAKGVTGRSSPIGDPYDIDFVAHEMGHQFGATHTQNNDCQRTNTTAVEPGSASTIMGYAGICAPNVQGQSDDYFHAVSIKQMQNVIASTASCATLTSNNNSAPVASAGLDYSIPKSTPFVLRGNATDADGVSSLTYNWEQTDNEVGTMPPNSTNNVGPMFRSLPSKVSSDRYMPALATVISGSVSSTWEVLPSVAREMNFSLLVRDNNNTGGGTSRDDMVVTVEDADAFTVTSQNTATVWDAGSSQTITWNKGTTDVAPINCANVNIRLSIDGGLTFPIILAANTANDGSEVISVPNNVTTQARILVEAADNIFYNVNSVNFEIESTTPSFLITNTSGELSACNTGNQTVDYILNLDFINGYSENVTFAATGNPSGSEVSFNPTSINSDGNVTLSVSNLDGITAGDYEINIAANSTGVNQTINLNLNITDANLAVTTLLTPTNQATEVSLIEILTWQEDVNASFYNVEVSSNSNFTDIVSSGTSSTNNYQVNNLNPDTEYYWRVKGVNNCNEGAFSTPFRFTTETPEYCAATYTDEAGGSEHITNVTFNSINNTSGNDTVDGYQDFTSINTNVFRNETYTITVTFDTAGFQDHCYVFIDWNRDFLFDKETERYDLGTKLEDISTATFSINVPSDAKFGKTTMRVLIEYDDPDDGFGDGPCDADQKTEWGEVEDYSITVTEPEIDTSNISVQTTSETCVGENDGIIKVDVKQTSFTYNVTVTGSSTVLNSQISGSSTMFENLNPGIYTVCIETEELEYTQCFEVEIVAAQQISLKATAENGLRKYTFNVAKGTAPYNVFLNEKLVRVSNDTNFEVEFKEGGKLEIKTAKECEGIFKTTIEDVLLLKNPVVDAVELLLPIGTEKSTIDVLIFDVQGKKVYQNTEKVQDNSVTIPFKNYAKGIYILKLSIDAKPIKLLKE